VGSANDLNPESLMELRRTKNPEECCFYLEAAMLPESNLCPSVVFGGKSPALSNHEHSAQVL
jgi:hypothetical protein